MRRGVLRSSDHEIHSVKDTTTLQIESVTILPIGETDWDKQADELDLPECEGGPNQAKWAGDPEQEEPAG